MWALSRPGEVRRIAGPAGDAGVAGAMASTTHGATGAAGLVASCAAGVTGAAVVTSAAAGVPGAADTGKPSGTPAGTPGAGEAPLAPPHTNHAAATSGGSTSALLPLALALVDLEVATFTDDPALAAALARTGARAAGMAAADYLFLTADPLPAARAARLGDALHPETAATLILPAPLGGGAPLRLTGPGIDGHRRIAPAVPPELWAIRARAAYPLGFDLFIVEGDRVIGLPRSTAVEVL